MRVDHGRVIEYKFAAKALEYGILIGFPASEKLPFDFFADNDYCLYKIQVKSTNSRLRSHNDKYSINAKSGTSNAPYKPGDFEFLVAYVEPENSWYVIPFDAIAGTTLGLYPHTNTKGKYEHYRERWDLLVNFGRT